MPSKCSTIRFAVVAAQHVAALAADDVISLTCLPFPSSSWIRRRAPADDRAVEAAAQAAVGGGHDQEVHLVLAGPGEERRGSGQARHAGGQVGQHRAHALGERARGLGLLLRPAQLGGRDELHRTGDLAGLPHRVDPDAHVLEAGHRRLGGVTRSARGTCRAALGASSRCRRRAGPWTADRVQDVAAVRRTSPRKALLEAADVRRP